MNKGCSTALLWCALIIPISLVIGLYYSWALTILWGWFVAPVFHLPVLGIWQMYGFGATLSFLIVPIQFKTEQTAEEKLVYWVIFTIRPLLAVLLGSIIRLFI